MDTPNFEALHGKTLLREHRAWRKKALKNGETFDTVGYAGLTREQAVEVYQDQQRTMALGMLGSAIVIVLIGVAGLFGGWFESARSIPSFIPIFQGVTQAAWVSALVVWAVYELFSVRTAESARRAYIRSRDERIEEAKRKSGIYPIVILSLFEAYIGFMLVTIIISAPLLDEGQVAVVTTVAIIGMTIVALAIMHVLIALLIYNIVKRKN